MALEYIEVNGNSESSQKACNFLESIKSGKFIIAMFIISEIFALSHPLSVSLQTKNRDLASAIEMANDLNKIFGDMRRQANKKFHDLFLDVEKVACQIGTEITVPRVINKQLHRDNYMCDSAEDFYRLSIYIPFLDNIMAQLERRFLKHKALLKKIQNILPSMITVLKEEEIIETVDNILAQWPDIETDSDIVIKKEVLLWQRKWIDVDAKKRPKNFIDSLNACNQSFYANVYNMLKHCATIPITIATPERTFSTLKRVKTYLRNSMKENRLSGLAHLSMHREVEIDLEEVIQRFKEKNRRISL